LAAEDWASKARQGRLHLRYRPTSDIDDDVRDELKRLQGDLLGSTGLATTLGHGPRFLHSTGQLHKGGPNTGLFIQLVDRAEVDVPVPGTNYTFVELTSAEALGDYMVLIDRGRRVLRIDLDGKGAEGVAKTRDMLSVMFQTKPLNVMA